MKTEKSLAGLLLGLLAVVLGLVAVSGRLRNLPDTSPPVPLIVETQPAPAEENVPYPPPQPTRRPIKPAPPIRHIQPTIPPVPTRFPTPVVTPFPVASPPYIPEAAGKARQPFWIVYWQGNEIWRVDDTGQEQELLLDTVHSLGQYLTAHPMSGSDCCWPATPRVAVSPDGRTLAVVVVDIEKTTYKKQPFTFSIYLFDVPSRTLKYLSQGTSPKWSPDGRRIAFVKMNPNGWSTDGGLWIADVETGEVYPLVEGDKSDPQLHIIRWIWSRDSRRIAYNFVRDITDQPGIWVKSIDPASSPQSIPNLPLDLLYGCGTWMRDDQHLLCTRIQNERGGSKIRLFSISVITGEGKMITEGFDIGGGKWSPDGKWLAFSGIRSFETNHIYTLWIINEDGTKIIRINDAPPENFLIGWSPDGTRLIYYRPDVGLVIFSLEDGIEHILGVTVSGASFYSIAIGGIK